MDKLSIYELFSYLIPGYVAIHLSNHFFHFTEIVATTDMNMTVFVLVASLIVGVIIHSFVDSFKPFEWFENLVFMHPNEIYKNDKYLTEQMKSFLLQEYEKTSNISVIEKINDYPKNLFDHAYYYLESKEKSGPVKNLHSLYYLLRNVAFLLIISLIIGVIFMISNIKVVNEREIFVVSLVGAFGCLFAARFLRKKYIGKTIKMYYSCLIHKFHEPR